MQQNIVHDISNLPIELYTKPLALIGFSGLDTVNNAIHKSIWEAFSNARRIENAPVHYKLISNAHEFPIIKPKRNSYDWYIPKGILKRNWMNKYLNEIPAVMVIFYELDWDDYLWNEKMIECASRVQSIRATLEGRNTRIIVVLIQNTVPLPHGDNDQLASERAVSLCASCELNSTSLYVLPHGDHLMGYVTRLEMAFFEFAQNYYYGEIKNVRSHKEHLNKTTHQYLIVRHQFKLGFLYELKQDKHTALKHYNYAYNSLSDIRIVDTNALEIRTIAGFINYKLCRLMFNLNLPRDAITQFKTHIDRFKNRIGFHELSFEHYAWLSKQFSVFGDIFDEAVKLGLPAVQTQHPGIYYQQAAQYAIIRKRTCFELCDNVNDYPQPDPLEGWNFMEFYGQRPWRPGKLTAEPPDPQLESNGIKALQFLEKQVAHSGIIVALFGLAISQYKTYRCPRTRRHLVLQMADEYYDSQDYGKALTLLTHMLWDFRNENWWLLLTDILKKALRCAFLTINLQDYILLSLEILNKSCQLNENDRKLIYTNFCRILQKQIPIISDCDAILLKQWETLLKTPSPINLTLDLTNIPCCIEIKPRFVKKYYQIDEQIQVEIYIKSTNNYCMNFTKLSLNINTTINLEFIVDNKQQNLSFAPNETKRFTITFQPEPDYLNKELQINCINLTIGNPNVCLIDLKFSNFNNNNNKVAELIHFKYTNDKIDFDNIQLNALSTLIVPRNSRLSLKLECLPPVLLGEWFPIKIHISNDEDSNIKDIMVQIKSLDDESLTHTEFSTLIDGTVIQQLPLILPLKSNYLQHNEEMIVNFYIRAHKLIENHIEIKISYNLDCDKSIISIKTENLHLPIVKPFEFETKFLSKLMFEIDKFYVGEQIGIMPILRCQSPWPIIIENTHLEFIQPFQTINNNDNFNKINMMKLNDKEIGTEIFLGVCNKSIEQNVTIGQYFIKWKRENGTCTTSQLAIIGHPCEWIPLELSLTIPAHGLVRTPLLVKYHFLNRSQQLLQLDVTMEASEAFMFSGYRQFNISILPESTKTIQYNLYPLIAGSVALPKLQLTIPEENCATLTTEQLKCLIERSLPTHLYVMPQIKGNPKISEIVRARKIC